MWVSKKYRILFHESFALILCGMIWEHWKSTGQLFGTHYLIISISDQRGSPIGGPKKPQTNGYRMYPMHSDRNSVLNHHHLSTGSSPGGFGSGHRSNSFDLGPRGQGHGGHHGHGGSSHSKHRNRLSALGRLFKPWKWKRRKKSEKFEKTSKCKFFWFQKWKYIIYFLW